MLCSGELNTWAGSILESLDETTIPTGSVVSWLKNSLGLLNLSLGTEFYVSGDSCIEPEMSLNISGIYTEMYICHFYAKQINKNLGAAAWDWVSIEGEDQGKIVRPNRNEVAKTFLSLSKTCKENLTLLLRWYNQGQNPNLPSQILFGERYGGANFDLLPPPGWYSEQNFVYN